MTPENTLAMMTSKRPSDVANAAVPIGPAKKPRVSDADLPVCEKKPADPDLLQALVSIKTQHGCKALHNETGLQIFVPATAAQPEMIKETDLLAFKLRGDTGGIPVADVPVWKVVGNSPGVYGPFGFGDHEGFIKKILPDGTGFVEDAAVRQAYGCDAFCHASIMTQFGFRIGDVMRYSLHISPAGKPQVSSPCWAKLLAVGEARTPDVVIEKTVDPTMDFFDIYLGHVSQVDLENGVSMIDVPEPDFASDLCADQYTVLPSAITVQDTVAFKVHIDAEGRLRAVRPFFKLVGYNGQGKAVGFGEHLGRVRVMPDGNAFIDCKELKALMGGSDVFAHKTNVQLCELQHGDMVAFKVLSRL
eukprot:gnl/TRDRNA2_/TRDRNA2_168912_c0_seq4.p1 gnl/TRDRNA2_/TRDRNA2_168912_c0~~gnl/TRDRNA2_/TRDRNA2_168912_c0_seq4.p1  ORF type:complete len:360 (+),score=50.51 gnl/TRDRNA2_/TRDRNA2_168912_c0_seq4:89-1168(+)